MLKIVKDALANKLNSFYILYCVVLVIVSAAIALRIALLPGVEGWGSLAFFILANAIYFTFLMLLSFSYELYLRVGWHTSLAILALVLLWPKIQQHLTMSRQFTLAAIMIVVMLLVFGIGFLTRVPAGKRMKAAFWKIRSDNLLENEEREKCVREAVKFFSRNETKLWFPRRFVRHLARKSAASIVYSINESRECRNKAEALQEFVKRHRLRDAIGRLAVVLGIAGALAYAVFPLSEVAEAVSLVVLKVLPVYGPALFVMDQFDEAREDAFGELQRIIDPRQRKDIG